MNKDHKELTAINLLKQPEKKRLADKGNRSIGEAVAGIDLEGYIEWVNNKGKDGETPDEAKADNILIDVKPDKELKAINLFNLPDNKRLTKRENNNSLVGLDLFDYVEWLNNKKIFN